MSIGWFPGHMHKARKDITKAIRAVDAVIEIVDARLPLSSENPMLDRIIGDTPRLKVLNKADLADPAATEAWLAWYQRQQRHRALALDKSQAARVRDLAGFCRREFQPPGKRGFRLMILGIPNVGKSTLMNILLDRKIAKVGNEPAVTKARQEIRLGEDLWLIDTPGVLWPKIEDEDAGYRLAASGAIRNTAFEFEDIALWTVAWLAAHYPGLLAARYKLDSVDAPPEALLEEIGRRRGCLRRGGVDFTRAGEILLQDLRSGKLGRISLETPPVGEEGPVNPFEAVGAIPDRE